MASAPLEVQSVLERHVSRRCPRMAEHERYKPGTSVRMLPVPCPDCYSVESFWRRIPWEPDSRTVPAVEQRMEAMGMVLYGEVTWDEEDERDVVVPVVDDCLPGALAYVDARFIDG